MSTLKLQKISKFFYQGNETIKVLNKIDFKIDKSQVVALVGDSGSGKSTLLHIAASLMEPTSGEVFISDQSIGNLGDKSKSILRLKKIGVIYQDSNLLSDFTAIENVMMPLLLDGVKRSEAYDQADKILKDLGLEQRLKHYPSQLSGGEQQRVAIARAFVHKPEIIFADEPTGNLDSKSASNVIKLFINAAKKHNTAILIVTHDLKIASECNKIYQLNDGVIHE